MSDDTKQVSHARARVHTSNASYIFQLTLLVLDFGLHIVDSVGGLDVEGDGLAGEGLDEDLRAKDTVGSGHT